jgi:hypothetical protein
MFKHRVIEPDYLDDKEKVEYLANTRIGDIFPSAFASDDVMTLVGLLARRIVELERGA